MLFIYDGATEPCADLPPALTLLPEGTGFVSGIPRKGLAFDSPTWTGVKFLITTKHVVSGKSKIIARLNRKDKTEFTCFPLELKWDGKEQNSFVSEKPEVDLAAIYLPKILDTDPSVIDYPLVLDLKSMRDWQVEEGTDIYTISTSSDTLAPKHLFVGIQNREFKAHVISYLRLGEKRGFWAACAQGVYALRSRNLPVRE